MEAATNRLPILDLKKLESARTPELLLTALNDAGKPTVLYSINRPVNGFWTGYDYDKQADCDGAQTWERRRGGNSYTYDDMGVNVRLSARPPPKDAKREGPDVTISFQVSADAPGNTDIGLGQLVGGFPMISQEHNEPLELGRPRIILAMGSSAAEQAKPFGYASVTSSAQQAPSSALLWRGRECYGQA